MGIPSDRGIAVRVLDSFVCIGYIYITLIPCILLHEMGHYWALKERFVPVRAVVIGLGPSISIITWNETSFRLAPVPLLGMTIPVDTRTELVTAPPSTRVSAELAHAERLWVMLAGVCANAAAVLLCFACRAFLLKVEHRDRTFAAIILQELELFGRATAAAFLELFTFHYYPRKESANARAMDEMLDVQYSWARLFRDWCFVNLVAVCVNLLPLYGFDGLGMIATIAQLAGYQFSNDLLSNAILGITALLVSGTFVVPIMEFFFERMGYNQAEQC